MRTTALLHLPQRSRAALVAVAAGAALALAALAVAPAANASDGSPCVSSGKERTYDGLKVTLMNCPLVRNHRIPVERTNDQRSATVGYIDGYNTNWFLFESAQDNAKGNPFVNGFHNKWWASTKADNGRWGWVNEVYFRGGGNDEDDGGLLQPPNLTCVAPCNAPSWLYPSKLRGPNGENEVHGGGHGGRQYQ